MSELVLPSNPCDRAKIVDAFKEISASKARIEGEKTYIKEAIAVISEEFDLPKRLLNKLANVFHKDNLTEEEANFAELTDAFEVIFGSSE